MSLSIDVYPELVRKFQGLLLVGRNSTNADQDITWKFADDTGVFLTVVYPTVKPGETKNVILPDEVLGLSAKAGKTIAVWGEIPTPGTGVYLLGTSIAPATKTGAVILRVTGSSPKLTIIDESGKAVPYAQVNLFDQQSLKIYTFQADKDGIVTLPDRINENYGKWLLEVVKYDYDRGVVNYALIQDYDWTDKEVKCVTARNVYVELQLNAVKTDTSFQDIVKNAYQWLPAPLKAFADYLYRTLGWVHDAVINLVLGYLVHQAVNRQGGNATLVKQEGDKFRIGFTVGFSSPIAWMAVLPVIASIIKWLIAFGIAFVVSQIFISWSPSKAAEVAKEREAVATSLLDKLKEAYDKGEIDKETYEQCYKLIVEKYKGLNANQPAFAVDWGLTAMLGLVVAMMIVIALIKTLRG
jgi:uncharacterized membrane protein